MTPLRDDISAYEAIQADLESEHLGKWALIYDRALVGVYVNFDDAAADAVSKFGRGPYLIRQIGAPPVILPASVMYRPLHAKHEVRV